MGLDHSIQDHLERSKPGGTGRGVNGFTLDHGIGEFFLSHADLQLPTTGAIYSINEGKLPYLDSATQRFLESLKAGRGPSRKPYSLRYVGSLVADIHRNLLKGGIFLYPATFEDPEKPRSKLRLLYEANPVAMLIEQSGKSATNGDVRIMEVVPSELHQTTPLVAGSRSEVEHYQKLRRNEK